MAEDKNTTEPTVGEKVETRLAEIDASFDAKIEKSTEDIRAENDAMKTRMGALEEKARALVGIGVQDQTEQPINMARLANAIATRDWDNAGYEQECVQATRALGMGSDTGGGYVVAEQYLPEMFIEMIRKNTVCFEAGAQNLTGLVGSPVDIPKQTGASTAYWGSENVAITASEVTLGNVSMVPHPLTGLVKMSNQLLQLSNPSVDMMVQRDMAKQLGLALDLAILKGSGADKEPLGISATPGINTYSMNATVTLALMDDMTYEQDKDDTLTDNSVFVMHTREWNTIRGLLIAAGITFNSWGKGVSKELQGYRVMTTNQLAITNGGGSDEGDIIFGNFEDVIVGQWGALEFKASQDAGDAFAKNQTWIRAIQLVDVAVRQPTSFCYTVDARA